MFVYNIRKAKYSNAAIASGIANRWNKDEEYVLYAGGTISLSALELVAHRSSINIKMGYKLLHIQTSIQPSDIKTIEVKDLPKNWKSIESYPALQKMGSDWYCSQQSLLLKVPSVLIPWESNYIINVHHPDFSKKVVLESVEDFTWDNRLI